jgi:DNA-binding transcriptional MerR regulator
MTERSRDLRIGELSRRTGASPELLRAWEQRYGLLEPSRSPGGFRLYSDADVARIRRVKELIAAGLSTAEAARRALHIEPLDEQGAVPRSAVEDLRRELRSALDDMDGERSHRAFDTILATVSSETAMHAILVPYLHELGDRWARGEVSIGQEHFASNLIRGRLLGIARDWASGDGPAVVLACPSGEAHDVGLIMFGIEIARFGWSVTFLGADTPLETLADVVRAQRPALVVLASTQKRVLERHAEAIRSLSTVAPVAIGGLDVPDWAEGLGARWLDGDPVEAARAVALVRESA